MPIMDKMMEEVCFLLAIILLYATFNRESSFELVLGTELTADDSFAMKMVKL